MTINHTSILFILILLFAKIATATVNILLQSTRERPSTGIINNNNAGNPRSSVNVPSSNDLNGKFELEKDCRGVN